MNEGNSSYYGSLCLTDILAALKDKHSAFMKSDKSGKIYFSVQLWVNKEIDRYGNSASVQLSSKKEMKDKEDKLYIGNLKKSEYKEPSPVSDKDVKEIQEQFSGGASMADDLPFDPMFNNL